MFMNKKSLSALLSNFESTSWVNAKLDGTDIIVRYLRVINYTCPCSYLHQYGLIESGDWVAERVDNTVGPVKNYFTFLPILESNRKIIIKLIKDAIKASGLPEPVLYTFPFDEIILTALTERKRYLKFVLNWIDCGYPLNDSIAELLPPKVVTKWKMNRVKRIFEI